MAPDQENGPPLPREAAAVLAFWFDELTPEQHFKRDDSVDSEIATRFGALHERLSQLIPQNWAANPRGTLAAIIVLDQFSRNLFRDDARAFAQDAAALALAKASIARGDDAALTRVEKQFLYMPLMHSEELADLTCCIDLMRDAGHTEGEDFARRHAAVIARFGRYPARNKALGRETTPEEAAFLADTPAGF